MKAVQVASYNFCPKVDATCIMVNSLTFSAKITNKPEKRKIMAEHDEIVAGIQNGWFDVKTTRQDWKLFVVQESRHLIFQKHVVLLWS
jgi:4-hydroxy-3-methylbut-2-enyl diphosphate reductase IspH